MRACVDFLPSLRSSWPLQPPVRKLRDPTPPGGIADEPTPGKPRPSSTPRRRRTWARTSSACASRYIFVTKAMLSPYLAANTGTQMNSYSARRSSTSIASRARATTSSPRSTSAGSPSTTATIWARGTTPTLDTHYTQFRDLSFISADVSIIGWHKFLPWLELRYGGGLGIGYVPGDVLITNNGPQCTAANASDPSQCYPINTGPINGKPTAAQEASLQASMGGGTDTNITPHRHSGDKPPVMGVVNILVGLRFYPTAHMAINWEIGFRDAMFTGLSAHYLF